MKFWKFCCCALLVGIFGKSLEMCENEHSAVNVKRNRYPFCVVWTPIPLLTWLFPFIGHMGICMSSGIIRDFAAAYTVSEDDMAFGNPTKYWQLDVNKVSGSSSAWDQAVIRACHLYENRIHNLCCDNCHSHVAAALNFMQYDTRNNWNMFTLAWSIFFHGKFVDFKAFLITNCPFFLLLSVVIYMSIY